MNLNHINVIARYEVKLVKRSWLFRIFAILALLFISAIMLGYQTGIVNRMDNLWPRIAVSSLMPFCNTYFYNIAQSVIVVFLAGSFLKRDKKLDTAEVIYVRPMSNADYIVGKTWGIVKVFITLNIITLLFTAFLNILINPKMDEVQGIKSYRDVKDLPEVDCAILAIAAKFCPSTVEMLAKQKNTRAFIILSAGFSEENAEGKALEKQIN